MAHQGETLLAICRAYSFRYSVYFAYELSNECNLHFRHSDTTHKMVKIVEIYVNSVEIYVGEFIINL